MQECRYQCEGVFHLCIQQTNRGREGLRETSPQCCCTVKFRQTKVKTKIINGYPAPIYKGLEVIECLHLKEKI